MVEKQSTKANTSPTQEQGARQLGHNGEAETWTLLVPEHGVAECPACTREIEMPESLFFVFYRL